MRCLTGVSPRMIEFILMAVLAASGSLPAFASEVHRFDIPEEEASAAIRDFGAQAHVQILVAGEHVRGKKLHAVVGELSTEDGLNALLHDSGLTHKYVGDNSVALLPLVARDGPTTGSSKPLQDGKGGQGAPGGFLLAQATPGQAQGDASVERTNEQTDKDAKKNEKGEYRVNTPEVLIVGSRVMNVDVKRTEDDVQPYYILDSNLIAQSGATNVEDFLKQRLTMNTAVQSTNQTYGQPYGAPSQINLRGLGTNETLILVDGRRSAGVSIQQISEQPDINGIPLSAIERIEVLPSSASAIYGGAAVGGVVNIILKKNFDGGEFSGTYGNTTSGSAPLTSLSATYGFALPDGKTRVTLSGHYSEGSSLRIQDRLNLVGRGISTILRNSPSFFYNSSTPFSGATTNIASADTDANGNPVNLVLKNGTPLNCPITHVPTGAAPGTNLSGALLQNACTYNLNLAAGTGEFGLRNVIGMVPTVKSLMGTIRRELTNTLELFVDVSTKSDANNTLYNPFFGTNFGGNIIPAGAPDNPFLQDVLVDIPNAVSPRMNIDSVARGATVGLLAHLPRAWNSEVDYTWSQNSFQYGQQSVSPAFGAALADGTVNPFVDTIAHPLNLTPYLELGFFSGRSTLNDLALRISGPLRWLLSGRATLTVGLEHRKEGSDNGLFTVGSPTNSATYAALEFFGQSQSTDSVYAEALLPLVSAVPLVRSLELQLAGRSERYTVEAGTPYAFLAPPFLQQFSPPQGLHQVVKYTSTNPTIGLKYKPVADVLFRVSYAKAFLPPSQAQLLSNPIVCSTCSATITDPANSQSYSVGEIEGGNPSLRPQTSRDWDLGVIFEPQEELLKGLRLDLQYYKITQPDYITQPTAQQVVSNPAYASRVSRDPTTGRITTVNISFLNAEEYKTRGWDLTMNYRKPTTLGTFNFRVLGTVIEQDQRQYTIGGPFLDFVGYPSENGEAKTKANITLSWEYGRWLWGWTTTYFSSYHQEGASGDPIDANDPRWTQAQGSATIPSQVYHDFFGSYTFGKRPSEQISPSFTEHVFSNLTIQFGIKNLFNSLPPFDAFYYPYYYSPYGDPRLRTYSVSMKKTF